MDWTKYNQVPEDWATASAIGLASATLGAMERRGFVESKPTKPKQYRRVVTPQVTIYRLIDENKADVGDWFLVRKAGAPYGMYCSLDKSGDVLDCYGKKYDLSDVNYIKFNTKEFEI